LQVGARHYPPKYALAPAVRIATGKSLLPSDHSGGAETSRRLEALEFKIVECSCGWLGADFGRQSVATQVSLDSSGPL